MKITSEMIKAARALLRWDQDRLAAEAELSPRTVKRIEKEPGPVPGLRPTVGAIEAAFARFGIEFLFDEGVGVRLRKKRD
jgi:DNA-binding XRE family transcriptional regulator